MRYRARVIPLYEGHKQEDKKFWGYRDAANVKEAQFLLMRAYPYPQYFVEEPILDLREGGKEKAVETHEERMARQEAQLRAGEQLIREAKELTKRHPNPGSKMKVVCAWCGKDMGERDGEGVNGLSHSTCDECYEDLHGMPKYYVVTDAGKTTLKVGETYSSGALKRENERVIRLGEMPASARSKGGV